MSDPECKVSILSDLRSPSTYSEVTRSSFSSPITLTELQALYLPERIDKFERMILTDLKKAKKLSLEHVTIEYDAANAFGTPVREKKTCYFLDKDGTRYSPPFEIIEQSSQAMIDEENMQEEPSGAFDKEKNFSSVIDCCLPIG